MSIAANRFPACRVALCATAAMARLGREHNKANVLALGSRIVELEVAACDCVSSLSARFEGGRHQRRIDNLGKPKVQAP